MGLLTATPGGAVAFTRANASRVAVTLFCARWRGLRDSLPTDVAGREPPQV